MPYIARATLHQNWLWSVSMLRRIAAPVKEKPLRREDVRKSVYLLLSGSIRDPRKHRDRHSGEFCRLDVMMADMKLVDALEP
jgi:hypothetical protein